MSNETFISVDIEASGPVPGTYSMLALGASVVGKTDQHFYAELGPISDASVATAMAVVGRTLEDFGQSGRDPVDVMSEFGAWVREVSGSGKPVFVGFNAAFDWAFVNWYFETFRTENPFGIGALDIKSFYMGMSGCTWQETRSSRLPDKYRGKAPHTHNALSDAVEQASIFERMARDVGIIK
ncbi:MAG: 3'-5' exonuclease [Deltaproteobacteria bacterium]|nr:3'-5' exonuclease [Deltaproteobacteria bacterium]